MKKFYIAFGMGILAIFLLGFLLYKFWIITLNLIGGFLLYLFVDRLMDWLERKRISGLPAYFIVFLLFSSAIIAFVLFVSIPLFVQIKSLIIELPDTLAQLKSSAGGLSEQFPFLTSFFDTAKESATASLKSLLGLSGTIVVSMITMSILAGILIASRHTLKQNLVEKVPNDYFEVTVVVAHKIVEHIQNYVVAKGVETAIMIALQALGFWLIGLPMPLIFGFAAGLFNLIPYLGPLLTMIPVGIIAFVNGGYALVGLSALVILVAQVIDNTVLQTWLISQFVDVHPFIVVAVTLLAGEIMGAAGLILGVPMYVIAKILISGLYEYLKSVQRHELFLQEEKRQQKNHAGEQEHEIHAHII